MDLSLFTLINGTHAPWADDLMLLASAVGRGGFVWIATAIIAAVFPRLRMVAWRVILSVALTFLLVDGVIKPIVHRDRPFQVLPDARLIDSRSLTGSFPSGHAASAVAGALSVGRLLPVANIVWWPLAIAIAVSRIYVGAHWPSDVLAGLLIGWTMAWFVLGGRVPSLTPRKADTARQTPML